MTTTAHPASTPGAPATAKGAGRIRELDSTPRRVCLPHACRLSSCPMMRAAPRHPHCPGGPVASAATAAKAKAKPLDLAAVEAGQLDFLARLEGAEARDTERATLSHRSQCPASPVTREAVKVPPIAVQPPSASPRTSAPSSRRRLSEHAPASCERVASARLRMTPRPSPHPSTPRAPRAVRTPKTGEVNAVGFGGFTSLDSARRK